MKSTFVLNSLLLLATIYSVSAKTFTTETTTCQECESIISHTQSELTNGTIAQVEQVFHNMCETLFTNPLELQACSYISVELVDQVVGYLKSMTPHQVCQTIGLCGEKQRQQFRVRRF
jgi:hypothetical protein